MNREDRVRLSILHDMSEGVMTLGLNGRVEMINAAALGVLNREEEELLGLPFAAIFLDEPQNEEFCQTVLDAVYEPESVHKAYVPYWNGSEMRQLHITSSGLREEGKLVAVILVLSDITELTELRDAVKAMERIQALNSRLEKRNELLSKTFGRYMSDEIVHSLLETPDGLKLGGRKMELTVMMSDLRGFTALSERLPAVDLLTLLNHYLGVMTDVIQSEHGTIIEFIGDGIMAIFGAPVESAKHAEEAVAAAVRMQAAMEEVNSWNVEHGYPTLDMGIGLNTGEVIVGNIGSEKRAKYGVTGATVNLCGRIESYTVGGELLISEHTREMVTCPVVEGGRVPVRAKGADHDFEVIKVLGLGEPYNVSISRRTEQLLPLRQSAEITFCRIEGKRVLPDPLDGQLLSCGQDELLMETSEKLSVYDNLQIFVNGKDGYVKVIESSPEGYRLRFTVKPAGFAEWITDRI